MSRNVPHDQFPFITCYGRLLNKIKDDTPVKFEDALTKKERWELGKVKYSGGITPYIIELDIWNNEPDVSGGHTQRIFNDAKDCSIRIRQKDKITRGLNFYIRDSLQDDEFKKYKSCQSYKVRGNVTNVPGLLKGNGDHCTVQIYVEMLERLYETKDIDFCIMFSYNDSDINVELEFNCGFKIEYSNVIANNVIVEGNKEPFVGNITKTHANQTIIEAYHNNKLQDQLILKTDRYYLFLRTGIYNFTIKNSQIKRDYTGIKVENGITPNYSYVENGLIKKQYADITEYYNELGTLWEVNGRILNEYGEALSNAEIIITKNDQLIMYYITDKNGRYKFLLDHDEYDVRIRSNNKRLKIIRNFKFEKGKGFFTEIQKFYNEFQCK